MLFKLLSSVLYVYTRLTTPVDYSILSEELEYAIDYRMKYQIEDDFWAEESKDWDGTLDEFHTVVTGKSFRHTIVPQNVKKLVIRVKYWYGGKVYKALSHDINFRPGSNTGGDMTFSIPLSSAWIVDHDDKPMRNITEKVKRYAGPIMIFMGKTYHSKNFCITRKTHLRPNTPRYYSFKCALGMKKTVSILLRIHN
jgi:hypothetical protein